MIPIIIAVVVFVLVVFVSVVAMQPTDFVVTRSATIPAPPEAVFAQVNDFHKWTAWNPWGKLDPDMKDSFEGAESGEGAGYHWVGNKNVGEGRMTITQSVPLERILIRLEFLKPFAAVSTADFTFEPVGDQTKVTWTMIGTNNFMAKAMGLFMNMDKMIGEKFEQGLADMKAIVESEP